MTALIHSMGGYGGTAPSPPPPPPPPASDTAPDIPGILHIGIAPISNANWVHGLDFAWDSTFLSGQFDLIYDIGYFGIHSPDSLNADNSVRMLITTGPGTAVHEYLTDWEQYTNGVDYIPLVPPGNGVNKHSTGGDNAPSFYFLQSNSLALVHGVSVKCHTREVIAGNAYPQTQTTETYIDSDGTIENIYNPATAVDYDKNWTVAFGVSHGNAVSENLLRTLRIYKPTGNPAQPYSATGSTYLLTIPFTVVGGPTYLDAARNSCWIIDSIFYVGGGLQAVTYAGTSNGDTITTNQPHGYVTVGQEMLFSDSNSTYHGNDSGYLASGLLNSVRYYVAEIISPYIFKISETLGGPVKSDIGNSADLGTAVDGFYMNASVVKISNSRLMAIDLVAVDNGDLTAIRCINNDYANNTVCVNFSAMAGDPFNKKLYELGSKCTYYDIATNKWGNVVIPDLPAGGYKFVQLKPVRKHHMLAFRGTLVTELDGGPSAREWSSIELPIKPLNLGAYTDRLYVDSNLVHQWETYKGDFTNYSGTPGVRGTEQSLSNPYGTIEALASDPVGTIYDSSDITSIMKEALANPTYALTVRTTGADNAMTFVRTGYVPGVDGTFSSVGTPPAVIITKVGGAQVIVTANHEWDFGDQGAGPLAGHTGIFQDIGGFHFTWPAGLVYTDIASAVFRCQKATNGTNMELGVYLLAPHLPCYAPASSEYGFAQVATTTDPADFKFDFPFLAADMPAAGAAAGYFETGGQPSHWGANPATFIGFYNSGPATQPDGRGGAFITVIPDNGSNNGGHAGAQETFRPLYEFNTLEGVGAYGISFPVAVSERDAMKLPDIEFFDAISGGATLMLRMSKGSLQNPDYVGIMPQIYQQGGGAEPQPFNQHRMLALRGMDIQYLVQIYGKRGAVGSNNGEAKYVIDQVLMGHITGQRFCINEASVVAAHRVQVYFGGTELCEVPLIFRINNVQFRAGAGWFDRSLFTAGPPA